MFNSMWVNCSVKWRTRPTASSSKIADIVLDNGTDKVEAYLEFEHQNPFDEPLEDPIMEIWIASAFRECEWVKKVINIIKDDCGDSLGDNFEICLPV